MDDATATAYSTYSHPAPFAGLPEHRLRLFPVRARPHPSLHICGGLRHALLQDGSWLREEPAGELGNRSGLHLPVARVCHRPEQRLMPISMAIPRAIVPSSTPTARRAPAPARQSLSTPMLATTNTSDTARNHMRHVVGYYVHRSERLLCCRRISAPHCPTPAATRCPSAPSTTSTPPP